MASSSRSLTLPFSDASRTAWFQRLSGPDNKNHFRLTPDKVLLYTEILLDVWPEKGSKAWRQKFDFRARFELVDGKLNYKEKNDIPSKLVVTDLEVFDLIVAAHLNLGHSGQRKT
jgi:hypothetical protein